MQSFISVQCLAPWLGGMVDPGLVQSELTALNAELTASAQPALAAFSAHITALVVRCMGLLHASIQCNTCF